MTDPYTRYPRATLWLLRDGEVHMGADTADTLPRFCAEVEPFYISKTPITNEMYEAFSGSYLRNEVSTGDDDPAVGISFMDALAYCDWYSELTGKSFRLPTEVEWEYACRADGEERYFFGEDAGKADRYIWHLGNSQGRAPTIEGLKANKFGLYDMLGGVWEWTSSLYIPYPAVEGDGRDDRTRAGERVLRGGSFRTPIDEMGCAVRRGCETDIRLDDVGFRIVRSL